MDTRPKRAKKETKPKAVSENEAAWDRIFQSLSISSEIAKQGHFDISADEIKEHGKREPRLMAKIKLAASVFAAVLADHCLSKALRYSRFAFL